MWTMKQLEESFQHFRQGNTGPNRFDDYDIWFSDQGFFVYGPPPPEEMVPRHKAALEEIGWSYGECPGGEKSWTIWRSD